MNETEKSLLIIKRDALLSKKNLFDIIEKHRNITSDGDPVEIRCYDITTAIDIHDWPPFEAILKSSSSTGAFTYSVSGNSWGGSPWGEDLIAFTLSSEFGDIYRKILDEYNSISIRITEDKVEVKETQNVEKISEEKELIRLVKSKTQAIEEGLLLSKELESIKQKIETFLDRKLKGESLLSLRYRKFKTQRKTLWADSNGFAANGQEYIKKYISYFEQYISEKRIRQRLTDDNLWVESVTQGKEQHIMVGERNNEDGDKVHVVMGETGEIRIDGKDKAPVELLRKAESILTTNDGKVVKTTMEFFNNQDLE